jgi:hypothetical protein
VKNLKLIQVLRTLKPAEFREFQLFMKSPFFNESKTLIHLTEILKKFYPDFNSDELNRHHVFKQLHPGDEYCDKKLRDACSGLYKLVIHYISLTEYHNDYFLKDKSLLITLDKRHLDKLFLKYIKHSEDEISQIKTDMPEHYLRGMEIKSIKTDFYNKRDNYKPIYNDIIERNECTIFYFIFRWISDIMEIDLMKDDIEYKNIKLIDFSKY